MAFGGSQGSAGWPPQTSWPEGRWSQGQSPCVCCVLLRTLLESGQSPRPDGWQELFQQMAGTWTATPTLSRVLTLRGPLRTVLPAHDWLGDGPLSSPSPLPGTLLFPLFGELRKASCAFKRHLVIDYGVHQELIPSPSPPRLSLPPPHGCYFLLDPIN